MLVRRIATQADVDNSRLCRFLQQRYERLDDYGWTKGVCLEGLAKVGQEVAFARYDAGIVDQDVEPAAELLLDVLSCPVDGVSVGDVELQERDGPAKGILRAKLVKRFLALFQRPTGENDMVFRRCFSKGGASVESNAAVGTC